jgi:hypothetical protein
MPPGRDSFRRNRVAPLNPYFTTLHKHAPFPTQRVTCKHAVPLGTFWTTSSPKCSPPAPDSLVPGFQPYSSSPVWTHIRPAPVDAPAPTPQNGKTGEFRQNPPKTGMSPEPNSVERAVARALRDNLAGIQRSGVELQQAINDVVAACSSSKPTNALPPLVRAQASAASLSAALEVLARFVALSLQPGPRSPLEESITQAIALQAPEAPAPPVRPIPNVPTPQAAAPAPPVPLHSPAEDFPPTVPPSFPVELEVTDETLSAGEEEFDVNRLTPEEQELHRRANRVAKVSMQDIKMLRPEQVRLGRQHKDICIRLKDDIEKAHREYDRRFKPIMDHPVDYFYRWLVEILAEGDASCLGEYPYATAGKSR